MSDPLALPDFAAIRAAHARIAAHIHQTPVFTSRSLDELFGATLFLKCENLQKVGAFKARGACNAVFSLPDEVAARGVVTHSSGNHGAAIAYAATRRGIASHVVMPDNAPKIKIANVQGFGAHVHFCAPNVVARETMCAEVRHTTGATLVHPYDDPAVIAGQGTAALELLEAFPDLDAIVAPIGGGGLLSGTAIAAHGRNARLQVFGAEPAGADDAARSFASGELQPMPNPATIADGLRASLSARTLLALRTHVAAIDLCSEGAIIAAMRLVWERTKLIIEPSSAVPLAAMLEETLDLKGKRVGVILTGGNVDLDSLPLAAVTMRVVVCEFMDAAAVSSLSARFAVLYDQSLVDRRSELRAQVSDAVALIVRNRTQVDADLLSAASKLKVVGRLGVGLDNIDTAACMARGIEVIPATGANAQAVAEYVIGAAMVLLRNAYHSTNAVADGTWPRQPLAEGREIAGKTLGLVGFGGIGRLTARLARAMGMDVVGFDPQLPASSPVWSAHQAEPRVLSDILAESDVISLHVPLTPETRGLVDASRIAQMKPDAILVNTARGGVVDEVAVAQALRVGRLGGAALDVFDREPLPAGSPLAGCPRLILTPHVAGLTRESNERVSAMVAEKVAAALSRAS